MIPLDKTFWLLLLGKTGGKRQIYKNLVVLVHSFKTVDPRYYIGHRCCSLKISKQILMRELQETTNFFCYKKVKTQILLEV